MERSFRIFQLLPRNRKLQAIFASKDKHFTENSRWVPREHEQDRGARRDLSLELKNCQSKNSSSINYLPDSHKLQPSWKYDCSKIWDEIADSELRLRSAGNGELECRRRRYLQIPEQYIYKIHDHYTCPGLLKSKCNRIKRSVKNYLTTTFKSHSL